MSKLRLAAVTAASLAALATAGPVVAAPGGDSNAGDVWTDNVGQPAGPGHEQDTHLACQDINLWGSGLADSSGSFTIDGWPPSGSKETDYSGTWAYDTAQGGDQVVAVISISQLIATAQANGDAPKNSQGYHFMLQFPQDPQKHKTFWVDCPAGTSAAGTQTSSGSTTSTTTTTTTATTTAAPQASVRAVKARRHRRRHRRLRHSRLSRRPVRISGFAG